MEKLLRAEDGQDALTNLRVIGETIPAYLFQLIKTYRGIGWTNLKGPGILNEYVLCLSQTIQFIFLSSLVRRDTTSSQYDTAIFDRVH